MAKENNHLFFGGVDMVELAERYGSEKAKTVKYAEAFEICEYGRQPTETEVRKLFPFFPKKK